MKLTWNGEPVAEITNGTEVIKPISEKDSAEAELSWNKFCLDWAAHKEDRQVQIFTMEVKD